ncbi:hypothetical protein D9756_004258 [Leucocoprinus leucothites]|uniref:Copper acquisition factor BIM1-like domain-containing protein n=1 Tax=Leucocoprinus leucothites TaxID=201217 RepID=A0A8H5G106_9AGAR|nr:hypothetical protein D9756_004258 [Leucoagaricus leucothites]
MRYSILPALALLTGAVNAHFHLNYPEPRGPFVGANEPNFCGGYTEVTSNRTTFPLEGGFFRIQQGHPNWAAAVYISTEQNPNSFDAFNGTIGEQYARYWAKADTPGQFCVPLDLSSTNITGVRDGANVTIQIAVTGGDGNLYQCADLTLSSNFTFTKELNDTCTNTTASTSTSSGSTPSPTSGALGTAQQIGSYTSLLLALGGVALATL